MIYVCPKIMFYHILVFVDYMVDLAIIIMCIWPFASVKFTEAQTWWLDITGFMHMITGMSGLLFTDKVKNLHCYSSCKSDQKCHQWHNVPCAFEHRLVWLSCHDRRDKLAKERNYTGTSSHVRVYTFCDLPEAKSRTQVIFVVLDVWQLDPYSSW